MLGPFANCSALIVGGVAGALLGRVLPRHLRETLPLTCGLISLGIGAVMVNRAQALPAVALALLAGAFIGELLSLERRLERLLGRTRDLIARRWPHERNDVEVDGFITKYVTILVLFCASGMGIFGATHEGMTGESNILLAKAVLDLFTAMIFATELGFSVALIALPQILVQGTLFFAARPLVPLATPAMLADFSACGGIIMLGTGLRICGIKPFPIVNMLPALVLAMPVSALWVRVFA